MSNYKKTKRKVKGSGNNVTESRERKGHSQSHKARCELTGGRNLVKAARKYAAIQRLVRKERRELAASLPDLVEEPIGRALGVRYAPKKKEEVA